MTAPRVVIVDDHALVRDGLPALLPDYDTDAHADVATFLEVRPDADLVLLDLDLAGTSDAVDLQGGVAVNAVTTAGYRVLLYTNERRRRVLVECLRAGASGIVHKAEPLTDLTEAIETVRTGGVVVTPALTGLAELYARRGELTGLTPRQFEILSARARGTANAIIAERLHLSTRTVEDHAATINRKFLDFLATRSITDLERHLGSGPGDLLDHRHTPHPSRSR